MPKFVPGCRVGILHNEHTRSTPLDLKLTFWCVSNYLGASGTVCLLYKTRYKTGRTSAKVRATKSRRIFRNERTRSAPLDPKLTFWCISYYLGAFGTVCLPYETRCKMGRTIQKFVPRSRVRIFRNERTRSTPLDPKLTFWCVSNYLGEFGTIWWPYKTRRKTGRTRGKVRAMMSRCNFSQQMHQIHPVGPQTDILVRVKLFG